MTTLLLNKNVYLMADQQVANRIVYYNQIIEAIIINTNKATIID
nr:hypothetical protein [Mycoplasmopsis bovis]